MPRTLSEDQVERLYRIRDELDEILGDGLASSKEPARDADAWRHDQASEAQLYTLRKAAVSFRPDITKGMASDLIKQIKKGG